MLRRAFLISLLAVGVVAARQSGGPTAAASLVSKGATTHVTRSSTSSHSNISPEEEEEKEPAHQHAVDGSQEQAQEQEQEQGQGQGQGPPSRLQPEQRGRNQKRFLRRGWLSQQPREKGEDGRDDPGEKKGHFATAAGSSDDDLRTQARRILRPAGGKAMGAGADVGVGVGVGSGMVAGMSKKSSLAFGNFLATKKPESAAEGQAGGEEEEEEEELGAAELALRAENDASVKDILSVIESDGWEYVTTKSDVVVVRKFMPPPAKGSSGGGVVNEGAAAKFACVKAMGTLNADARELYKLFLDNERVHEYNDNCKDVRDLEQLSSDTKVSWAATPRYGPFKSRDFVTAVHYRTLDDGTMMVINRPVEHPAARHSKKYVRAEILIATNIMRPNREDPTKTDFISVTHINPGGIVDSRIGAKIVNKLCAKAPVNLLLALERCANSPVPELKEETDKENKQAA